MYIKLHGGDCCGIKHIHDIGSYPELKLCAREPLKDNETSYGQNSVKGLNDQVSENDNALLDLFNEEAPQETYVERMKRFIAFIQEDRTHGVIEVVTSISQTSWYSHLEKLGFKKVSEAHNTNSGYDIVIWHLVH